MHKKIIRLILTKLKIKKATLRKKRTNFILEPKFESVN